MISIRVLLDSIFFYHRMGRGKEKKLDKFDFKITLIITVKLMQNKILNLNKEKKYIEKIPRNKFWVFLRDNQSFLKQV